MALSACATVTLTVKLNAQVEMGAELLPGNDVDALEARILLEAHSTNLPTR